MHPEPAPQTITILGAGWLGLPLGRALAAAGHRVRATTTTPEKLPQLAAAGLEPVLLRLEPDTPPADFRAAVGASEIVVAAFPPGLRGAAGPEAYLGRLRALAAALPGTRARQLLLTSSTGVYPDRPGLPAMTEADADPANPLVQGEEVLRAVPGLTTTVARLAGLMGPGRHPGRFFGPGRPVPQPDAPVNMLHLTDAVGALRAIIEQRAWGLTFNVCAAGHPARRAFYAAAAAALGQPAPDFSTEAVPVGKCIISRAFRERLAYDWQHDDPADALTFC